jgi:cob(I)alamin adenosyltransferase
VLLAQVPEEEMQVMSQILEERYLIPNYDGFT